MTELIGLAGAKRSGKNTVAEMIAERHDVKQVAFATKLKVAAMRALGCSDHEEELVGLADDCKENWKFNVIVKHPEAGDAIAAFGFDGRNYLQWFGSECGRQTFGDTFWIDQVLPNPLAQDGWPAAMLSFMYPECSGLVVTDVRFPNEAERIKSLGGQVWEVQRPGLGSGDAHASETPLPRELVDRVINNDGSLDDLRKKVEACL